MPDTKLEGCPFCGAPAELYSTPIHIVLCAACEAEGPEAGDEERAIAAWNTRALTPKQKAAEEMFLHSSHPMGIKHGCPYDYDDPETNRILQEERGNPMPVTGTFACPICGVTHPHEHTGTEIAEWRATLARAALAKAGQQSSEVSECCGSRMVRDVSWQCTSCGHECRNAHPSEEAGGLMAERKLLVNGEEIDKMLKAEIAWHQEHTGMTGCDLYEFGFIRGLKQACLAIEGLALAKADEGVARA